MGPMTGRAAGFCAGYGAPGFMSPAGGRGYWGRGRGGGRGWRHWYHATGYPAWGGPLTPFMPQAGPFAPTMTAEQELDGLKKQAEYVQDALSQINQRIEQLEAKTNK